MKVSTCLGSFMAVAAAQSVCDQYATSIFGSNTAATQEKLFTFIVNTAAIGNYSHIKNGIKVPGFLTPTTYKDENVNLLPYFDGTLASSNTGGKCGAAVNWLDGGGAAALKEGKAAFNTSSNQYTLLNHLYQLFAGLSGCSKSTNTTMKYAGNPSMYDVHKFMDINAAEFGWFVKNFGLAGKSVGFSPEALKGGIEGLDSTFGYRCQKPESLPPFEPKHVLQSICINCDCPLPRKPDCSAYDPVFPPHAVRGASKWCGSKAMKHSVQNCNSSATAY